MLVAILLPVALSLLRFVPGIANSQTWTFIQSALILPAVWGKRHREPIAGGQVPTRGQALYIALISVLNIILLVGPYVHHHPQSTFVSLAAQELSIIGNRAGCMAMGNVVVLFIFAGRNNVLLYITDWSHGTYLLLHRWLGYWAVFHTVLHSVMLLGYYKVYGTYEAELAREYWRWGIVGTVAVSALTLTSLLVVRQRLYEFFLASHVVLSLLFIIGYYYHIWFLYKYNWGYEIWIFVAGGIWGVERLARLARMAWQGFRTATVTSIADTEGEYLRIDIEGVRLHSGVAYLCFPTLGWRFWETHPFSVAFSSDHAIEPPTPLPTPTSTTTPDTLLEKSTSTITVTSPSKKKPSTPPPPPTTTFLVRVRTGITARLATRTANPGTTTRLTVLLEGPYPHDSSASTAVDLSHCTRLLYIAGGVGITALLPHLRQSSSSSSPRSSRLVWSTRRAGLADALAPVLAGLGGSVEVEVSVGVRADLDGVLEKELAAGGGEGLLGIVVCGPAGMADCVRHRVVQVARSGRATRGYVLVDEAYGW
jgi:predicted ferric reductase